jgi:hypothetical protein
MLILGSRPDGAVSTSDLPVAEERAQTRQESLFPRLEEAQVFYDRITGARIGLLLLTRPAKSRPRLRSRKAEPIYAAKI